MNPVQDVLDAEKFINENIIGACSELQELYNGGALKENGILNTAVSKIDWLSHKRMVVETFITKKAVEMVSKL